MLKYSQKEEKGGTFNNRRQEADFVFRAEKMVFSSDTLFELFVRWLVAL